MTNNKQQTEINAVEYIDKVNQFAKENNTDKPKQQTAVEYLIHHIRQDVFVHSKSTKEWNQVFQQAKEMENQQSQLYATFCLRCANENLPIIRFKDWIKLEGGEQ
jgi:hypothetical protein